MDRKDLPIERKDFEALVHAIGFEIEHAQVKLVVAANTQMLFHYWKLGTFIRYHQNRLGWGGKVISQLAQAIRMKYPEKKGYSYRNLSSVILAHTFLFCVLSVRFWYQGDGGLIEKFESVPSSEIF